jgi:hypothetical protein
MSCNSIDLFHVQKPSWFLHKLLTIAQNKKRKKVLELSILQAKCLQEKQRHASQNSKIILLMVSLQLDPEASTILKELQVKLNGVLDELSITYGER